MRLAVYFNRAIPKQAKQLESQRTKRGEWDEEGRSNLQRLSRALPSQAPPKRREGWGGMSHFHTSKDGANRKAPRVKLDKLATVHKTWERESDSSTPSPFIGGNFALFTQR